jgi:hypothetical protein
MEKTSLSRFRGYPHPAERVWFLLDRERLYLQKPYETSSLLTDDGSLPVDWTVSCMGRRRFLWFTSGFARGKMLPSGSLAQKLERAISV